MISIFIHISINVVDIFLIYTVFILSIDHLDIFERTSFIQWIDVPKRLPPPNQILIIFSSLLIFSIELYDPYYRLYSIFKHSIIDRWYIIIKDRFIFIIWFLFLFIIFCHVQPTFIISYINFCFYFYFYFYLEHDPQYTYYGLIHINIQ